MECGKCKWWFLQDYRPLNNRCDYWGTCKRYPPTLVCDDCGHHGTASEVRERVEFWAQPVTFDNDLCGEFQPSLCAKSSPRSDA